MPLQGGVVEALKVSRLAVRRHNLTRGLTLLGTVETLHRTRPTIHTQLTRQEYSSALELIATSRDILGRNTVNLTVMLIMLCPQPGRPPGWTASPRCRPTWPSSRSRYRYSCWRSSR